jgi:hypothetical protein
MSPFRRHRWVAGAITLMIAGAWLLASNHCAIAATKSFTSPAHACCHEKPAGKSSAPVSTQCCAAFSVPVPEHLAAPVADLHVLKPAWMAAHAIPITAAEPSRFSFFAHAPPEAGGWFRTVLTRCMPAHAPPSFVV